MSHPLGQAVGRLATAGDSFHLGGSRVPALFVAADQALGRLHSRRSQPVAVLLAGAAHPNSQLQGDRLDLRAHRLAGVAVMVAVEIGGRAGEDLFEEAELAAGLGGAVRGLAACGQLDVQAHLHPLSRIGLAAHAPRRTIAPAASIAPASAARRMPSL